MPARIRARLTYANVMATLALFVALGGGAYAAVKLPANSVGSKQLKPNAVTTPKLRAAVVTRPKLAANSVDGSKVVDGSLTGADINLGTLSASVARVKTVTATGSSRDGSISTASLPIDGATAACDPGLVVVGGGVSLGKADQQLALDAYPSSPTQWTAHVVNADAGTPGFTVYAICAPAAATQ